MTDKFQNSPTSKGLPWFTTGQEQDTARASFEKWWRFLKVALNISGPYSIASPLSNL